MMYDEAIASYTSVIDEEPSFALAYLGRGKTLTAMGRFDEGVRDFSVAMDLEPKNDEVLATVAMAYIERNLQDEGLIILEKAEEQNPLNPTIHLARGLYHVKNLEYSKAIEEYLKATKRDKAAKEAYIRISGIYCCAENPMYRNDDLALDYAGKALEIAPDDPAALDALAYVYYSRGDMEKAIEYETKALEMLPENRTLTEHLMLFKGTVAETAEERNNRGAELLLEGNYSEAADEFRTAIEIDPNYSDAYYNLGKVYSHLEDYSSAEEYYITAIEIDPDDARYHYNLAIVYGKMEMLDKSEEEYLYAISIDPFYDKAHNNLGALYVKTGKLEQALAEFTYAYEINQKGTYKANIDMVREMLGEDAPVSTNSPTGASETDMLQY
ncbi:MAG: tetratricopeptide repeat protein [Deltaproteobacteria bacterium]|nr:tetratricopeptide repeat protein [Candidatus Zymogenaceae bacterium]